MKLFSQHTYTFYIFLALCNFSGLHNLPNIVLMDSDDIHNDILEIVENSNKRLLDFIFFFSTNILCLR